MVQRSIVAFTRERSGTRCGYCKSPNTDYSDGMWAYILTVQDYQDLIDRGWRRSGCYCYKPIMKMTCCPRYTIKCEALNFKLTKSQKRILKRVHRFLATGEKPKTYYNQPMDCGGGEKEMSEHSDMKVETSLKEVSASVNQNIDTPSENKRLESDRQESGSSIKKGKHDTKSDEGSERPTKTPRSTVNEPPSSKSKIARLLRKKEKLIRKGILSSDGSLKKIQLVNRTKSLEDYINEPLPPNPAHRLELRIVRSSKSNEEFMAHYETEHQLYVRYQAAIHRDPPEQCTIKQFTRFLVNTPMEIRSVPTNDANYSISWPLFVKYQIAIHNETEEDNSMDCFTNFLGPAFKDPPANFGSFHQQYWLDDKLIAVGVIDILPNCVSSVYFFYDPDYSFLCLGTYGSLREIELVRKLALSQPSLKNYYMGFYIHTCRKMKYKAKFYPSFLLCPETYTWHPIEKCLPLIDASNYSRLEPNASVTDPELPTNISNVLVLWNKTIMRFSDYRNQCEDADEDDNTEVAYYAQLVGRKCASRIVLFKP